jgi:NTP pyrophosphatase (non-canonical NTP hydrolase)
MSVTRDETVNAVIERHKERTEKGITTYGTTVYENPGDLQYWLNHAQEEALDLAVYIQKLREKIPLSFYQMLEEFQDRLVEAVHDEYQKADTPDKSVKFKAVYEDNRYQFYHNKSSAAALSLKLIVEEYKEFMEAVEQGQPDQDVLKEMCDLIYVVVRMAVVFEFPLEPAFRRVHENNMAKIKNGTFNEDGKLVKPKDHPKPDLTTGLEW